MKKFFKFGCLGVIVLIVLIIIIAIASNGGSDKPSTGVSNSKTTTNQKSTDDGSKKVDASSQSVTAEGLKVSLGEIKIYSDKIEVGMNADNTNKGKVSFYPDQGNAVIGDMQLDANMFLTDGSISGDIQGGVKKEAVLEFLAPEGKTIDVKNVKEIKLMFGDVFDEKTMNTTDVSFTVPVK